MGLPERLKEVREEKRLNQEAFGALGGVSLKTQNRYESGGRKPTFEYLESLAAAGVDVIYLLTGRRDPKLLTEEERKVLDWFRALGTEARDVLLLRADAKAADLVAKGKSKTVRQSPGAPKIRFVNAAKASDDD
jgi:transcriptional regulator with XRE-family HTH domain